MSDIHTCSKGQEIKVGSFKKERHFVGYSETSKTYKIYVPCFKKIAISRDVTFDEDAAFNKSKKNASEEVQDEEPKAPRGSKPEAEKFVPKDHDELEPQKPKDPPKEVFTSKRRLAWARELMQEAEKYGAPYGTFKESKRPKSLSSYVALLLDIIDAKPTSYEEVVKKQVWQDEMVKEYNSIMKNEVWDTRPRPKDKSVATSKWIYKIKHAADGSIEKYKARFVARGFSQKEAVDYEETFVPVTRYTSIRAIMAVAAKMGWKLHQMDVKTAFLNGVVEEVYVKQPQGFETHDRKTCVQVEESSIWFEVSSKNVVWQNQQVLEEFGVQ